MTLLGMGLQDISRDLLVRTGWSGLMGCTLYAVYLCIYRLYFHPLSGVPGPKLAAITRFYEAYYNVLGRDGQYLFKTQRLHEIYGRPFSTYPFCKVVLILRAFKVQSFASRQTRFQLKTRISTIRSTISARALKRIRRFTAASGSTIPCSLRGATRYIV